MIIKELLMEASKYDSMFQKISKENLEFAGETYLTNISKHINDNIKWARQNLKREDRIVWYLRLFKIATLKKILEIYPEDSKIDNTFPDENDNLEIKKEKESLVKELKKTKQKANFDFNPDDLNHIKNNLMHFIGQEDRITEIQNYTFSNETPQELFDNLDRIENEWIEKTKTHTVTIQEGDKEIEKFDDGVSWWLLNRGACREEADAMGHCGNVPTMKSGDRILSLRKKVSDDMWEPHLTFILDEDGYLGEMKGRKNDKPDKKYHPYIIKLLKNKKLIKGIKGGGYLQQNNFSLSDLSNDQIEELIKINPDLLTIFEKYERYGPTDEILDEIKEKLYDSPLPDVEEITKYTVILDSWNRLRDFANISMFIPLHDLFEAIDAQNSSIDEEELENLAERLTIDDEIYLDILTHIPENYLTKISDSLDLNIDVSSYKDLRRIAENIDKSYYGKLIRKGIVYIHVNEDIEKHPEFKDYVNLLMDEIYYLSMRNEYATLDYDINNLDRDVELKMDLKDFVNVLQESLNEGDYNNDEAYMVARSVIDAQDWSPIDSFEIKERIGEIKSGERSTTVIGEQNSTRDLYNKFEKLINFNDNIYSEKDIKLKEISKNDAIDVAKYFTKSVDLNEGFDISRIKKLAGV